MILVFDTSAFSAVLGRNIQVVQASSNSIFTDYVLPLAADAELRFGFQLGNREQLNLEDYHAVKQLYNLQVTPPTEDTAVAYADLATWCRKHGVSLSHNDLWIAATCIVSGGQLLTLDKDFARLPQVSLVALT